jgi:hypothetical protein
MKRIALACAAAAIALTGCSDSDSPKGESTPVIPGTTATAASSAPSTSTAPAILAPTDTGRSKNAGVDVMILSVEDVTSRYGPVTVITFQLVNTGNEVFQGYNWPTPTLVYGAAGMPAEHTMSMTEGYGEGVTGAVPPGMRQTVKHAYKVTKDKLNPAVVTAGSIVWQGDLTAFQR